MKNIRICTDHLLLALPSLLLGRSARGPITRGNRCGTTGWRCAIGVILVTRRAWSCCDRYDVGWDVVYGPRIELWGGGGGEFSRCEYLKGWVGDLRSCGKDGRLRAWVGDLRRRCGENEYLRGLARNLRSSGTGECLRGWVDDLRICGIMSSGDDAHPEIRHTVLFRL